MRNTTSKPKLMSMQQTNRIVCLITFICLSVFSVQGQDMHFTNNNITPTFFNPAQTGNFSGTVRAGLIFRDQMEFINAGSNSSQFRTFSIGIDAPLIYGFSKNHWLGVGLTLMNDNTGIVSDLPIPSTTQKWNRLAPSVGYHIGLDKKFNSVFSIGLQYGLTSIAYEGAGALTETGFLTPTITDPDIEGFQQGVAGSYGSINVGVTYKSKLSKTSDILIGAGVMHLQSPSFTLSGDGGSGTTSNAATISRRINIHGLYRTATSKSLVVEPSFTASFMGPQSNIQLQFRTEYLLKSKGDLTLIFGAGYRISNAPQFLTGARYKDWVFSLSYDHSLTNVADISPSSFELGATKIFTLNKKPDPKPIIYCPRI